MIDSLLAKLTALENQRQLLQSQLGGTHSIGRLTPWYGRPALTNGKRPWLSWVMQVLAKTPCTDFVAILSAVPVTHWNKRRLTSTSYCASVGRLLISLRRSEKPILCDECTLWKSRRTTAMPKCNCKRGYKRDKNEYLCHSVCHRCSFSSLSSSHHIHNLKFQTKLHLWNEEVCSERFLSKVLWFLPRHVVNTTGRQA